MIINNFKAGDRVDKYNIVKRQGKGYSGKVYVARINQNESVALKLFSYKKTSFDYDLRKKKFVDETIALNRLKGHPNIVTILDESLGNIANYNDKDCELIYYTMELLNGSLEDYLLLNKENWKLESRIEVLLQVVKALEFAHSNEIFHRDLHLGNILLEQQSEPLKIKISDFGCAKLFSGMSKLLPYYFPIGKIESTSPEACVGLLGGINRNIKSFIISDIFSLGLLLYSVVTSQNTFSIQFILIGINYKAEQEGLLKNNATDDQREYFLYQKYIPILNDIIKTYEIIITEDIKNKEEVQNIINQLFHKSVCPDYQARLDNIKEFITDLENCLELMK